MPDRVGRLARVDFMELVDGVLVSFTYTRNVYRGEGAPYQLMLRVDEQGHGTRVAERALSSGYGPLYTNSTWWFSPVLWQVQRSLTRWTRAYRPEFDVQMPPRPPQAKALAALLLLASLALAYWRGRRTALSPSARWTWVLLCALVGLPALMAMWLLYPPRERLPEPPRALAIPVTG